MRVVFFGTPAFALPSFEALRAGGIEVAAVVTQPDRPRGRSHSTLLPSPVKQSALAAGIPVMQPEHPRGDVFMATLRDVNPDLAIVVAYGHVLTPELLELPRLGCVNVHASLLPRWRGAAPIQWAILAGDAATGISIMRLEAGLDTGPVWLRQSTPINTAETSGQLFERLAPLGAQTLMEALPMIALGAMPMPQDEASATLAPKIDRSLARVRWNESAAAVSRRIRAMDPMPGAWATLEEQEIKVFGPHVAEGARGPSVSLPGSVAVDGANLRVGCADGDVIIAEVQPAGKRRMPVAEWLRGSGLPPGSVLT